MIKIHPKNFQMDFQQLFAPFVLFILLAVFLLISGLQGVEIDQFLINILEAVYFIGFLAIGSTFVIITGGIDLSSGTVMMCSALIGAVVYHKLKIPIYPAFIIVILTGAVFGLLNGFLIAILKLPPFIATLGTMMIAQSFGAIVSRVQTMHYPPVGSIDGRFKSIFARIPNGFPTGVVWLVFFFLLAYFILNKTRLGKYTYAIGSNAEATRLSGINTSKWLLLIYILNGLFCGFAAIFYAAVFTTIIPASGSGQEMQAIAGVVIGGTSLSGGIGTLGGTLIGVLIMAVLKTGLMIIGTPQQWQLFFTGLMVILAVLLDMYRRKNLNKV